MPSPPACRIALFSVAGFALWCTCGIAQQSTPKSRPRPQPRSQQAAPKSGDVRQTSGEERVPRQQRPQPQKMRIEPLPAELEQLLKEWEVASAKVEKLVGEHKRIVYNGVFEVEKQAGGEFYYEAPDKGRIDIEGIEPEKGQVAKRKNPKTGNPYRVEADTPSKWICTGKEILTIDEEGKTFEAVPLPTELRGKNIIHGPLPFLFGMKAEDAKRRFELSFIDQKDPQRNNEKVVWLMAKPRQDMDRENFAEAQIILDRKRFLPYAVKLKDPSGNLETVYTFENLSVNKPERIPSIFRRDPFQPDLKRYKMMLRQADNLDEGSEGRDSQSNGNRTPIRPTAAASAGTSSGAARPQRTANSNPSGRVKIQRSGN